MGPDYQNIYNALNTVYDPNRQLINTQLSSLPGEETAAMSSLEQAKVNAFKDISNRANASGMLFSGFRPNEEATYTGEKFLPALAGVKSASENRKLTLLEALNNIGKEQTNTALGQYKTIQDRAAEESRFTRQLEADRENARISAASNATVVDPYKGFNAVVNKTSKGKATGTSFFGPGNQPITAAQYYSATGTGIQGVENFLQNDQDPTSKKAYKDLTTRKLSPEELTKKYPYIFGGV